MKRVKKSQSGQGNPPRNGRRAAAGGGDDRELNRKQFEIKGRIVAGALGADASRHVPDFQQCLLVMHAILLAMAQGYLTLLGVPNAAQQAEDVVQQWFVNMLRSGFRTYWNYGRGRPFFPYAAKVLWNLCLTASRKRSHASLVDVDLIDRRCNPLQSAMQTETKAILLEALEALPPTVKESIRLRYLHEKWPREIAEILEATSGSVSSRILRGLHRLYDVLQERQHDLGPAD